MAYNAWRPGAFCVDANCTDFGQIFGVEAKRTYSLH